MAEVDGEGRMLRSNWLQGTGLEGTPGYDAHLRARCPGHAFRIERDGCRGYRDRLASLLLPPASRR